MTTITVEFCDTPKSWWIWSVQEEEFARNENLCCTLFIFSFKLGHIIKHSRRQVCSKYMEEEVEICMEYQQEVFSKVGICFWVFFLLIYSSVIFFTLCNSRQYYVDHFHKGLRFWLQASWLSHIRKVFEVESLCWRSSLECFFFIRR